MPKTMRLGADKLEATRTNAEFWLEHGRAEPDLSKRTMYMEQSINAWKNAAYGLAEQLATKEAAALNPCGASQYPL